MSYSNGPKMVTNGLVMCLDAGNRKSYPGSGTTCYNLVNSSNNGVLYNITYNTGGWFDYAATNNYMYVPSPTYSPVTSFTYNCWVFFTGGSGWRTIFDVANDTKALLINNARLYLYNPTIDTGYDIPGGVWFNVAVSHTNGGPAFFYINGNLIATSGNFATSPTTSNYGIGGGYISNTQGNEMWTGRIAQVSVYNRGLSLAEIKQNYDANKGRFGL